MTTRTAPARRVTAAVAPQRRTPLAAIDTTSTETARRLARVLEPASTRRPSTGSAFNSAL
jgi:FXSXX-COOH protein